MLKQVLAIIKEAASRLIDIADESMGAQLLKRKPRPRPTMSPVGARPRPPSSRRPLIG